MPTKDFFEEAFAEVMEKDGIGQHTNNQYDRGGETFSGISRLWWSEWGGWDLLDDGVKWPDERLQDAVSAFYVGEYWLPLRCVEMSYEIAVEVFDSAVHMGKRESGKIFQRSLNILNRQERTYEDVVVDGFIGNKTMVAYRLLYREEPDEKNLYKTLNIMQGAFLVSTTEHFPRQEMNFRGWLKRVNVSHGDRRC